MIFLPSSVPSPYKYPTFPPRNSFSHLRRAEVALAAESQVGDLAEVQKPAAATLLRWHCFQAVVILRRASLCVCEATERSLSQFHALFHLPQVAEVPGSLASAKSRSRPSSGVSLPPKLPLESSPGSAPPPCAFIFDFGARIHWVGLRR